MTANEIVDRLGEMFPNAGCELAYRDRFQLLCAVMLSAQTTDKSVNRVTPALFAKYADAWAMAQADQKDVESLIRSIGLYHSKASHLIAVSRELLRRFDGEVPGTMEELRSLPGVGRKTANVVLAEGFGIPALAVDTHVERVSKRLGMVPAGKTVEQTEQILQKKISKDKWISAHHRMIFFGRYMCHAKKPACGECPFAAFCRYRKGRAK